MSAPSVTVVVLTFNGERYLDALLEAVEGQRYPGEVELLRVHRRDEVDRVAREPGTDRPLQLVELPGEAAEEARDDAGEAVVARQRGGGHAPYRVGGQLDEPVRHHEHGRAEPLLEHERIRGVRVPLIYNISRRG